jgi:hypothetical protein
MAARRFRPRRQRSTRSRRLLERCPSLLYARWIGRTRCRRGPALHWQPVGELMASSLNRPEVSTKSLVAPRLRQCGLPRAGRRRSVSALPADGVERSATAQTPRQSAQEQSTGPDEGPQQDWTSVVLPSIAPWGLLYRAPWRFRHGDAGKSISPWAPCAQSQTAMITSRWSKSCDDAEVVREKTGPRTPKPARGGLRKCLRALVFLGCGGRI